MLKCQYVYKYEFPYSFGCLDIFNDQLKIKVHPAAVTEIEEKAEKLELRLKKAYSLIVIRLIIVELNLILKTQLNILNIIFFTRYTFAKVFRKLSGLVHV